ncbi:MAG: branched-chain amino acid ABC transporter ATP-binding protein, partial [Pseudomonadota bacterium]
MSKPVLLLLDEPSTGLAPLVKDDISAKIREIRERGVTILLVEQDTEMAFDLGERIYILENGKIALEGSKEDIEKNPYILDFYLGIS